LTDILLQGQFLQKNIQKKIATCMTRGFHAIASSIDASGYGAIGGHLVHSIPDRYRPAASNTATFAWRAIGFAIAAASAGDVSFAFNDPIGLGRPLRKPDTAFGRHRDELCQCRRRVRPECAIARAGR
jgi:hypothetical protein